MKTTICDLAGRHGRLLGWEYDGDLVVLSSERGGVYNVVLQEPDGTVVAAHNLSESDWHKLIRAIDSDPVDHSSWPAVDWKPLEIA